MIQTLPDPLKKFDKRQMKASHDWFASMIKRDLGQYWTDSPQLFLGKNIANQSNTIQPGQMIAFFYDPKTKEKLPYYDTFPLIFPWDVSAEGFIGINLHYVKPQLRMLILQNLINIKNNDKTSAKTKIGLSWSLIRAMSTKVPQIEACVKRYLFDHVKSKFIIVPPTEWQHAVLLPVQRFKKETAENVWRNAYWGKQ